MLLSAGAPENISLCMRMKKWTALIELEAAISPAGNWFDAQRFSPNLSL
jgi:hypothetical protein